MDSLFSYQYKPDCWHGGNGFIVEFEVYNVLLCLLIVFRINDELASKNCCWLNYTCALCNAARVWDDESS